MGWGEGVREKGGKGVRARKEGDCARAKKKKKARTLKLAGYLQSLQGKLSGEGMLATGGGTES